MFFSLAEKKVEREFYLDDGVWEISCEDSCLASCNVADVWSQLEYNVPERENERREEDVRESLES